jgi:hypothetical protein
MNIPALIVAINQSRAFDTVFHSYMTSVYRFFNIGERFIALMNAIGTGRSACIIWEDGSYSSCFDLKSGRAQGDGPSPLQYNFAEQILLFRLELDPGILSAVSLAVEAARIPVPLPWFGPEANKKTNKVEALADDTTVIMHCCKNSLDTLKQILIDFGDISGLKCNIEKTTIMPVGGIQALPFDNDTGFTVDTKIKLLGIEIDNGLTCLEHVHLLTIDKICSITRFWSRFWLSLPGRINIVKTMCLSQINYLGSIIKPSNEQLNVITTTLEKFVKGKLNISRDRLYTGIDQGGLGLIDINQFIVSQQVLWIKRSMLGATDNWREDL